MIYLTEQWARRNGKRGRAIKLQAESVALRQFVLEIDNEYRELNKDNPRVKSNSVSENLTNKASELARLSRNLYIEAYLEFNAAANELNLTVHWIQNGCTVEGKTYLNEGVQ